MSNHAGGYLLNEFIHGLVEAGPLRDLCVSNKESLSELLWHLCCKYDCNWGEIIDVDLAVELGVCSSCPTVSAQIDSEEGWCPNCSKYFRGGDQ